MVIFQDFIYDVLILQYLHLVIRYFAALYIHMRRMSKIGFICLYVENKR